MRLNSLFTVLLAAFCLVNVNVACAQRINTVDFGVVNKTLTAATGNTFASGDIGYVNSSGEVALANALNSATASGLLVMATEAITGGNSGVFRLLNGEYTTSGLTPGSTYYLDTTDGAITATAPSADGSVKLPIGKALSATKLIFGPINEPVVVNVTTGSDGGTTTPTVTTPTVETTSSAFESDGTVTTTAPLDIEAGDMLILFGATDQTDATETTYTPPSGFTDLITQQRAGSGGAGTDFGGWYKVAGTSEGASYDLGDSTSNNTATVMMRISGVDPNNLVDVSSCSVGNSTTPTAPDVAVTVDDAMILVAMAWDASKTLDTPPAGFTESIHNDQSGVDLWVGSKNQATSGASGTSQATIGASAAPWVACTIALKEPNAVSTPDGGGGGGGGTSATEGAGPFTLLDDGTSLAIPMKLTLPIACDGTFSGSACEIFPSTDSHWSVGDPALETYEHPTYFIRDPDFYTFCSPNTGATTATASNGRSELRYLQNHNSGTVSRQYIFRLKNDEIVDGVKANIGQIHRGGTESSPVFKGTYTHDVVRANTAQACGTSTTITLDASASGSDDTYNGMGITLTGGTNYLNNEASPTPQVREITDYVGSTKVATVDAAWDNNCSSDTTFEIGDGIYRILSKKTNGGSDFPFDIGLGDKVLLDGLTSNSFIRVKYDYDIAAETLDFWVSNDGDTKVETELTGGSTYQFTAVELGAGAYVYSKLGMYMNDFGVGATTTPYCVQTWQDTWTGP